MNDNHKEARFAEADSPFLAKIRRWEPPTETTGPVVWMTDVGTESLGSYFTRVRSKEVTTLWTATERLSVLCGVVLGLKALHDRGLFSVSLKPSTMLLDSEFAVRLTGYVSGSFEKSHLTTYRPIGAPDYSSVVSPESDEAVFDLSKATCVSDYQKVDIFGLGVAIYKILTGREVFASNLSAADLARQIRRGTRLAIPGDLRPEFWEILEKCSDANPSRRPSIDDVWEAVWFMGNQIIGGVDWQLLGSRFDGWAPSLQITVQTLDNLKKGHYIDCGELGSGGQGRVRRHQVGLDREIGDFTAKFYQQDLFEEEDIEHFTDLLQAFGGLRHPCLTRIVFAEAPRMEIGPVVWTEYCGSPWAVI
jgi:serine/threonine protein kinase